MITYTLVYAALMIALGIAGFAGTGFQHPTALIPVVFGIAAGACGLLAMRPNLRRHAMHGAAGIALLGFLGTVRAIFQTGQMLAGVEIARPVAVLHQAGMAALSLVYFALCAKSFIDARVRKPD